MNPSKSENTSPKPAVDEAREVRRGAGKFLVFVLGAVSSKILLAILGFDDGWVVVLVAVVLAVTVWATLPGGPLSRSPDGVSLLGRIVAYALLAGYVALSTYGSTKWSAGVLMLAVTCLTAAVTLLLWPTLKRETSLGDLCATGVPCPMLIAGASAGS